MTEEQKFKLRDMVKWYGISQRGVAYRDNKENNDKSDVFLENVMEYAEEIVEDRVHEALGGY